MSYKQLSVPSSFPCQQVLWRQMLAAGVPEGHRQRCCPESRDADLDINTCNDAVQCQRATEACVCPHLHSSWHY